MKTDSLPIQERLENYLLGLRPHHAVILAGPHTPAKEAVVRKLAARVMEKYSPATNKLNAADRVARDIHPDVLWIKEEGEDSIKIDRIREVCHQMEIAPLESGAKICVIEECHRMNHAASNAFLKTLEEPLPNRYFWLMTSQIGSLLPTLLSRCLTFIFPPDEKSEIEQVDPAQWNQFQAVWDDGGVEKFAESFEERADAIRFVRILQLAIRNTVLGSVIPSHGAGPRLNGLTVYEALRKYESVIKLESQLRSNANFSLLLESALTQLRQGQVY